jgi:hypothetical protein
MTGTLPIDALTRRLAECPEDFLAEPRLRGKERGVRVAAVVSDLLEDLGSPERLSDAEAQLWESAGPQERNLLRLTLVAAWLCGEARLREGGGRAPMLRRWLESGLRGMAEVVAAELFVTDPDRREELARSLCAALGCLPEGETAEQASDRLKALSSVERAKVIRETRAREERARRLREKMEAERAREAAARFSSE